MAVVAKPKESPLHGAGGESMIPGIPGGRMNPRQMKAAMKRMGIETEEIPDVEEVVIRTPTKEYVFKSAEVSAMTVQGQKTWQIVGEPIVMNRRTEGAPPPAKLAILEEDIDLVAEKAGVSKAVARKALEEADGEPAEAIIRLMSR
jgi:nascent polypeptide-associated complex subunit alpha